MPEHPPKRERRQERERDPSTIPFTRREATTERKQATERNKQPREKQATDRETSNRQKKQATAMRKKKEKKATERDYILKKCTQYYNDSLRFPL
jgi:hypothetical protein